jgi:hypothetical protein
MGFERMEDRLALSAATGMDYIIINHGFNDDLFLTIDRGGLVTAADLDVVVSGTVGGKFDSLNSELEFSSQPRESSYQETFSGSEETGPSASDFDHITPIPQPNNQDQQLGGTIELTHIFAPTSLGNSVGEKYVSSRPAMDSSQIAKLDSETKEPTFARGRDVYFEVASLTAKTVPRAKGAAGIAGDPLVPLNHEAAASVLKALRPTAETGKQDGQPAQTPTESDTAPGPVKDVDPQATPVKAEGLRAAESAADDPAAKSARREQAVSEKNLVAGNAHDQALAELWREESMAEEVAVSLRSNEGNTHYAALPTIAVLVGGSLVARHRRNAKASELQPLRKRLGSSLREE